MQRRFSDYLLISFKGMAMGAADAVPGVSGGTIAFISGIYEELISTISGVNLSLWTTFRKEGFRAFWIQANGNFLIALLAGIFISYISFMRLAKFLIEEHPVLIWSFFFGLIIASIILVAKQIKRWNVSAVIALVLGAAAAYYITSLPSMANNENPFFLFFAGALAICAMILPGISGSFILVILGAYKTLSDAIHDYDIKRFALFAVGALAGLLSFSRVLKWLFNNYKNTTLAALTGFIFGSLNKIWPWKETLTVMEKSTGNTMPINAFTDYGTLEVFQNKLKDFDTLKIVTEKSILPGYYSEINFGIDSQVGLAIGLMLVGFLTIIILEKIGNKSS